jgi:hypothetical protein
VEVPTAHIAPGGPTGHEHALTLLGGPAAQRLLLECGNGYRRDILPTPHGSGGSGALSAKPLKRHIELKLVRKKLECQVVKSLFPGVSLRHKRQKLIHQPVHRRIQECLGCYSRELIGVRKHLVLNGHHNGLL